MVGEREKTMHALYDLEINFSRKTLNWNGTIQLHYK